MHSAPDRCPRSTRWRIGAQGLLVAGDGRRHAQAGVGIEVVGTDEALGQLVEDVVVLGQQLAGEVEGDGIGAVGADGVGESLGGMVKCVIPGGCWRGGFAFSAQLRMQQSVVVAGGKGEAGALGA